MFLSSCADQKEVGSKHGIETIYLSEAYKSRGVVNASQFVSSFEYIQLETKDETLMRGRPTVYPLGSDRLIVKSHQRISLYDRRTGQHLKDIGHFGQDPNGFLSSLLYLGNNNGKKTVYAKGWRYDIFEYSINNGELVHTIPKVSVPNSIAKGFFENGSISSYGMLDANHVVGYVPNVSGKDKLKLVIYDHEGNFIKFYPNHQLFVNTPVQSFNPSEGAFHNYKGSLLFKEWFDDTLFQVGVENIKPRFIFDMKDNSPPYAKKDDLSFEARSQYMFTMKLCENSDNLFFQLNFKNRIHMCRFEKRSGKTYVSELESNAKWNGFKNDIDSFLPFYPSFVTDQEEIAGIIPAEEVYEWFQNNQDTIQSLPTHLRRLRDIQPEDNPIVMIGKSSSN